MDKSVQPLESRDKHYFPWIDVLRCISWFLVVVCHCGLTSLPTGAWGVALFFAISGFLITRIMLSTRTESRFLVDFYSRRWTRIAPPYYIVLSIYLLMFCLPIPQKEDNLANTLGLLPEYLTFTIGFFKPVAGPFGIAWTIAVEECFYLVAPLLYRQIKSPLGLQFLLVGLLSFSSIFLPRFASGAFFGSVSHFLPSALICGCFFGLLCQEGKFSLYLKSLMLLSVCLLGTFLTHRFAADSPMAGFLLGLLVFICSVWKREFLLSRLISRLGRFSYELYLIHIPFTAIASRVAIHCPLIAPVIAAIMTIPAGLLLYRLVSLPGLQLRRQISNNPKLANLIAIMQVIPIPVGIAYYFLTRF